MTFFLREDTASQEVPLGPFVDDDGVTPYTGAIANTDISIWKTGGTTFANPAVGATHVSNGNYVFVADATDSSTIGPMKIMVHVSGTLQCVLHCTVLDEAVYDVLFGTTALATTGNLGSSTIGTATAVTTVNGLAAGVITAASIAADAITAAKVAADVGTEIATAVWDRDATGSQTAGTFGAAVGDPGADTKSIYAAVVTDAADASIGLDIIAVKADTAAILVDTGTTLDGRIPAALVGGRMDANVGALSGDATAADNSEAFFDGTGYAGTNNVIPLVTTTTTATNVTTVNGLAANVVTAASLAADAGGEIADAVWDEAASGHVTSGTFGQRIAIIRANTAQAGAGTTITLDASASAVDDFYNNTLIHITAGTGVGQSRFISDYDGTTKVATVPTWATNPSSDSVFVITPFGAVAGASAPTAAEVADAVWDEDATGHQTGGTFGQAIGDPVADTNTIFKAVVTDAAGATVGVDVVAVKADTAAILVDTGTTLDGRIPAALTAGGLMKADALAIDGSTDAADRLQRSAEAIGFAVVGVGSTTTSIVLSSISPALTYVADQLKGRIIIFAYDTGQDALKIQATDITANTASATPTLTCTALTTAPTTGAKFVIL